MENPFSKTWNGGWFLMADNQDFASAKRKTHYSTDLEYPLCNQSQSGLAGVDLTNIYDEVTCKKCKKCKKCMKEESKWNPKT